MLGSPRHEHHPYLEIVTPELDKTCKLYGALWDVQFSDPIADLGNARTAKRPDGTLIGIRAPMAEHEEPIVRTYVAVPDVQAAAKAAESQGALIAYAPTKQGDYGTFCIVIHDGLQLGLWQA